MGSIYAKLNLQTAIPDTLKMLKLANTMKDKLRACGVILAGDFNASHTMWGDTVINEYGKQLADKLDYREFSITTAKTPTFLCENGFSVIDLMIMSTNLVNKVESCITDEEAELFSGAPLRGHVPVIMKLTGSSSNTKTVVTEKIDINSINWELWSNNLEKQIDEDEEQICSFEDPCDLWSYAEDTIQNITSKHCVIKKSTKHSKPYWTPKLTRLSQELREAREKIHKT